MRIAELSQYYPPYIGGQETYVASLSQRLARMGHEVFVITTNNARPRTEHPEPGLEIRYHQARATPLNNALTFAAVRERELLDSCDVVHLHNEYSFLTLSAALGSKRRRAPEIVTLHGDLRIGTSTTDGIARAYRSTLGNSILRRADGICTDSVIARQRVIERRVDASKVFVLPNGIDTQGLAQDVVGNSRELVRAWLGIPMESKLILFVGRLIRRKGVLTLVNAFAKIAATRSDVHLLCVGEGPLRTNLERFRRTPAGRGRVSVASQIPSNRLHCCYQAADLFVLPSISEGCPTVVLEALFYGCPVLTTDIPGIRDHFEGRADLVQPEDPGALALRMLADLSTEKAHGARVVADDHFLQKYDWGLISEGYDSAFNAMLPRVGG